MAGLALLLFWILAQANIAAHEILSEHTLDTACEWQCKTNNKDDLTDAAIAATSVSTSFTQPPSSYAINVIPSRDFQRPFLRGPPS